jgi:hypothetical protein
MSIAEVKNKCRKNGKGEKAGELLIFKLAFKGGCAARSNPRVPFRVRFPENFQLFLQSSMSNYI